MQLKLIELFRSIRWAKNGDLTDFSQTNYEAGWAHLGDDTPTVQDFNYVQAMNDQKDQWLFAQINEVLKAQGIEATEEDLPALKRAIENLVTAKSTPKTINSMTKNGFDEDGHSHEITKANTTQAGIVQLTDNYNGDSQTLGLTQKAGKAIKALIDSLTRSLSNYIPNSKKSNSTGSNSSDTVATSFAVKTAFDRAVLALNTANNANDNANGRVSKAGDTMTGKLFIESRVDGAHSDAGIVLINKGGGQGTAVHFDGAFHDSKINKGGLHISDAGGGSAEASLLYTPEGDANKDRRQEGLKINKHGQAWVNAYGFLHDYFAKQSDNNNIWNVLNNEVMKRHDFIRSWYPNHYAGAEVYKIRHLSLMITVMSTREAAQEIFLPEAYDGFAIVIATDMGGGNIYVRAAHLGSNRIYLGGRSDTHCGVIVIGAKNV